MKKKQYTFKQRLPGGGTKLFSGTQPSRLVDEILQFRRSRGLPKADYNLVYNEVLAVTRKQIAPASKGDTIGLMDAIRAITAAAKNTIGIHTNQREMDRRVAICANCPLKTNAEGCYG